MSDEAALTLQVHIGSRTVDFTVAEAARELGVSEEFIRRQCQPAEADTGREAMSDRPQNAGEQIDAIMLDLDRTTAAWVAAGYGYGTPEDEAREAVFARLKAWNARFGADA